MKRNRCGQSMVEYAIGIGCVAALCMVALGSLGYLAGDMIMETMNAINYNGSNPAHQARTINTSATPWVLD